MLTRQIKDSGVEWIGEIPVDWDMKKVKSFLKEKSEKNHGDEEVLSLYRDYGVVPKNSRDDNHNVTSQDTSSYKFVKKDNVVINKMKAWQGSLAVSKYQGIVSPAYFVYEIKNKIEIVPEFLHYALRNPLYTQVYQRLSAGLRIGQWDLSKSEFNNLLYPIPPVETQIKIVKHINEKTEIINLIIQETQQSIEELKKYKQSIISEVVTKGLDKNVEMKDSSIGWIGDIPCNWMVSKFKNELLIRGRVGWKGLTASEYIDEKGYAFLSTPDIKDEYIDFSNVNHITKERYDESPEIMLEVGDVLLTKDGSTLGTTNIVRQLPEPATVNSSLAVLKVKEKLYPLYLFYFIQSSFIQAKIAFIKNGMGVPHLFQKDIKEFEITIPDYKEQQRIAEYLENKIGRLNELIRLKREILSEYELYKKSLIYEYVTGKKEV